MFSLGFPIFAIVLAVSGAPPENSSEKLLDELRAALQLELIQQSAHQTEGRTNQKVQILGNFIAQLSSAGSRDGRETENVASQIASYPTSERIAALGNAYLKSLRAGRVIQDQAALTEVEGGLKRAAADVRAAKTAKDLDETLIALGRAVQKRGYRSSENTELQAAAQRLSNAYQSVQRWQDFLSQIEAGNTEAAKNTLRNLAGSGIEALEIPRSEILAREQQIGAAAAAPKPKPNPAAGPTVEELLARIKTLDDLRPTLDEINKLPQERRNQQGNVITAYDSLARAYLLFKSGLPAQITEAGLAGGYNDDRLTRLRAELILTALPRFLNLPAESAAKPEEGVETYLRRVLARARQEKNWDLLARALAAQQSIARNLSGITSTDSRDMIAAMNTFVDGLKQERAQQYSLAVGSYQAALKQGTLDLPAEEIGEHLAKIKAEHPKEFEEGMQRFLDPPVRMDPRIDPYGMPPGMAGRMPRGYVPPTGRPGPLEIPSVSPAPSAAPSPSAPPAPKAVPSASPSAPPA